MTRFGILAVCTGNVHRSPLAAVMIDRWARWYLPAELSDRVSVASAGTGAPVGAPMGSRPLAIAAALGADGRAHRATQLSDDALVAADLVLVASRLHRDQVLSQVPSAMRRTFTFREAGRIAERLQPRRLDTVADLRAVVAALAEGRSAVAAPGAEDDVIDPQGLGDDAYRQMAAQEVPALASLAAVLLGMPPGDQAAYRYTARESALLSSVDGASGSVDGADR